MSTIRFENLFEGLLIFITVISLGIAIQDSPNDNNTLIKKAKKEIPEYRA